MTRSDYVSTLPPWRRLLAMLNWRPVYDIEQETERLRIASFESERRLQESEKRLQESERRLQESEKRLKQLQESNARIARFEQELFSSSTQTPSTGDSSPT
jgi:Skp family chaperone for outer membrane proteins